MKVLVIDDHPDLLNLVKAWLTSSGHDVVAAETAADGLMRAVRERPDVVVCELSLPDLDGFEVAARLRAHRATWLTPIVLVTASGTVDDRTRALQQGIDEFLRKPYSAADLEARLEALVRRSRQSRAVSPLTGLPAKPWIMQHVNTRLRKGDGVALAYLDIDHFAAYRSRFGDARSEEALRFMARILAEVADSLGTPGDMIGHFGEHTFAYVGVPEGLEAVIHAVVDRFDRTVATLYDELERSRRGIEVRDPMGVLSLVPLMSLSIGACINERRALRTALQMSEACGDLRRDASLLGGSAYLIGRPRENRPMAPPRAATA